MEIPLSIWRLALTRMIELIWNNSKLQWEFDTKILNRLGRSERVTSPEARCRVLPWLRFPHRRYS